MATRHRLTTDSFHTTSTIFTNTKRTTNTSHIQEHIKTTATIDTPSPLRLSGTLCSATVMPMSSAMSISVRRIDSIIRASFVSWIQAFRKAASTVEQADRRLLRQTTRKRSWRRKAITRIRFTKWSKTSERKFTFGHETDTTQLMRTRSRNTTEACRHRSLTFRKASGCAPRVWMWRCLEESSTIASQPTRFTIKSWKKVKRRRRYSLVSITIVQRLSEIARETICKHFRLLLQRKMQIENVDVPPDPFATQWVARHKTVFAYRVDKKSRTIFIAAI